MTGDVVHAITEWVAAQLGSTISHKVHTSYPGDNAGRTLVWMGDVDEAETRPAGFRAARIRRIQEFTIPLVVEVSADGVDQREADRRCRQLQDAVESFFAVPANINAQGAFPTGSGCQATLRPTSWAEFRAPTARTGHYASRVTQIRVNARVL